MPESKAPEAPDQASEKSAIARLASDPVSRRRFMALTGARRRSAPFWPPAAGDSGTTTTTTTSRAAPGDSDTEQFGKGDVGILNYALTLEYLETAFYADVIKSGLFKGSEQATIEKFGKPRANTSPR